MKDALVKIDFVIESTYKKNENLMVILFWARVINQNDSFLFVFNLLANIHGLCAHYF